MGSDPDPDSGEAILRHSGHLEEHVVNRVQTDDCDSKLSADGLPRDQGFAAALCLVSILGSSLVNMA